LTLNSDDATLTDEQIDGAVKAVVASSMAEPTGRPAAGMSDAT
jgi:hypothetical protein